MTELLGHCEARDIQSAQGGQQVTCITPVCEKDGIVAVSTHGVTWPCKGMSGALPGAENVSDPDTPTHTFAATLAWCPCHATLPH